MHVSVHGAATEVFQLRNGDRIAGTVLYENTNGVAVGTGWSRELIIPLDQIASRKPDIEPAAAEGGTAPQTNPPPVTVATTAPSTPKPEQAKRWRADAKLGVDLTYGAKDRQLYYGQFALFYARPQKSNSGKYFRNTLEYRADYAETEGVESANRMSAGDKADLDIGRSLFVYNYMSGGFDQVRKIDQQYEVGPGMGWHALSHTKFTANIEGGMSYQVQDRAGADRVEAFYGRVGQDIRWNLLPRVTITQRASLLTAAADLEQMQLRMEANLSLGIARNLSFNITAIDLYDTRPPPGVSQNEFQLRTSIGIAI